MKYLAIAISGASDHPTPEFGNKTPLELAKLPNLHHFAKLGKVGQVKLTSDNLEPSSDSTFLNMLGYDASKIYTGQGPLEAANLDLKLDDNEVAFRVNFITESEGTLSDSTGGNITTRESRALINYLNKKVASDFVRFYPGANYRHVAVIRDSHGYDALSAHTQAPDEILGQPIEGHFPKGPGEELLRKLMYDARLLLQDHEINQVRLDLRENPANMIWLWGQGRTPELEHFRKKFHHSGALLSSMEYARGIGRLAGLDVVETEETGHAELDMVYEFIAEKMIEALGKHTFVCVHLNGADEASRLGDAKTKTSTLEAIDFFLLSKVKKYLEDTKDVRVLITPCHTASWKMRRHVRETVPFVIAGKNVMPDDVEKFTETAAHASELKIGQGTDLMPYFLTK